VLVKLLLEDRSDMGVGAEVSVARERTALGSGWAKDMAETRTALAAANEVDMVSSQVSGHFPVPSASAPLTRLPLILLLQLRPPCIYSSDSAPTDSPPPTPPPLLLPL
jgi:hypothetical protein